MKSILMFPLLVPITFIAVFSVYRCDLGPSIPFKTHKASVERLTEKCVKAIRKVEDMCIETYGSGGVATAKKCASSLKMCDAALNKCMSQYLSLRKSFGLSVR